MLNSREITLERWLELKEQTSEMEEQILDPTLQSGWDWQSSDNSLRKLGYPADATEDHCSNSPSPALDVNMEESMDLDQILEDLASSMNQSIVNTNEVSTVKDDTPTLSSAFVSTEEWDLLGDLDKFDQLPSDESTLNTPVPNILDINPSFTAASGVMIDTAAMDCFDPEFYETAVVRDTLADLMGAPDSADCTVVNNPLLSYLLDEKAAHTSNWLDKELSDAPAPFVPQHQVVQKLKDISVNRKRKQVISPLALPSTSAASTVPTPVKEEEVEREETLSPLLVLPETSVSIDNLLAAYASQRQPTAAPTEVTLPSGEQPVSFVLKFVGIPDLNNAAADGQQVYNLVLEPSAVPSPSPSPALSVTSSCSSASTSVSNRKRSTCSTSSEYGPPPSKLGRIAEGEEEDDRYQEMRKKNNEASRRSRLNRREKEKQNEGEVHMLEMKNKELKEKLDILQNLVARVKKTVIEAISKNSKQQ